MKFGVFLPVSGRAASRKTLMEAAQQAERLGFDSVWAADRLVIPWKIETTYPYSKEATFIVPPDRPFFVYWAPGAAHGPHHIFNEWADRYAGKFDGGWDQMREEIYARQKKLGWIPKDTELTPRPDTLAAWADIPTSLSAGLWGMWSASARSGAGLSRFPRRGRRAPPRRATGASARRGGRGCPAPSGRP